MALEQTQKFCKRCNSSELHARPAANHLLHLLITVLLCGLWLPIWILSALQIGGWRCQRCGTKPGTLGFALYLLVIPLVFGFVFWNLFLKDASPRSAVKLENKDIKPADVDHGRVLQPPPIPDPIAPKDVEQEPNPEPVAPFVSPYLKSLEGIPLPVTLVVDEGFSLLDSTGKEFPISEGQKIVITKRSAGGTLSIVVGGKLFVGNETRLSEKVRKDE